MALPTYTLSTSVLNVDCLNTTKVILLPPASTIQGVSLFIRDCAGVASDISTIYVSTQGLDLLDQYTNRIALSTAYQSLRLTAWQGTGYAIVQNYTDGLTPFLVRFTQGLAWTQRASFESWQAVASSSSGTILLAGVGGAGGRLYVSPDAGASWNVTGPTHTWYGVAVSGTATKMIAVANDDRIYTSTDTGLSWTPRASIKPWTCVCSSSDGSICLAGATGDTLYLSTNSGVTWTSTNGVANYTGVACSSDGSILYAVANGDTIYVSTNSGSSWTARDSVRAWTSVACTSNGVLAFATEGTYIYASTDTGSTWTANLGYTGAWRSIACSATGTIVVALNGTTGYINFSETQGNSFINSGDAAAYQAITTNQSGSITLVGANPGYLYVGQIQLL
jgi:hypothetical protein